MKKIKVVTPKQEQQEEVQSKGKRKFKFWSALIVVVVCVALLAWALPMLPLTPAQQQNVSYQGVVELWNVETFEGGVGSREAWLTGRSAKFESAHKGLFVHVTTLSVEQLETKLNDGQNFDLICFSRGVGDLLKQRLMAFDDSVGFVKDNFLVSGQFDGKQYAIPLYCGTYCLFARTEQLSETDLVAKALSQTYTRKVGKNTIELQPLVCGFTPYNSPLSALALSGGHGEVNVDEQTTQYQAYEQFVANRTAVTLLGTQRDIYRLSQREDNGKIEQLGFAPLCGYTDLVQYVGVSLTAGGKTDACVEYVKYLLSEEVQSTLVNLSLFSVLDQTFYTQQRYVACEQQLAKAYVPNAFGDGEAIIRQRETAKSTLLM